MYPVVNQNPAAGTHLWEQFSEITGALEEKIPTLDKSLDVYFDRNLASIIEEWDLLTDSDLRQLEGRLDAVTHDISMLYMEKTNLEKRAGALDDLLSTMEKSV